MEVRDFTLEPIEGAKIGGRLLLVELLAKAGDGDFPRRVAETIVRLMMEPDAEGGIGAGRQGCTGKRTVHSEPSILFSALCELCLYQQ